MVLEGKRIVVVEDDVVNMAVISLLLKQQGARVIQDAWNRDTVNRIKALLPVDIILLDLMLREGVSGYDIYRKIKADPALANVPVVIVSASDPVPEMKRAQQMGFMGFISKPISYQEFPVQIEQVLLGMPVWAG